LAHNIIEAWTNRPTPAYVVCNIERHRGRVATAV